MATRSTTSRRRSTMIYLFDMSPLATLLAATAQMRALTPTDRERAAWVTERAWLVAGVAVGLAACVVAFPEWRAASPATTDQPEGRRRAAA